MCSSDLFFRGERGQAQRQRQRDEKALAAGEAVGAAQFVGKFAVGDAQAQGVEAALEPVARGQARQVLVGVGEQNVQGVLLGVAAEGVAAGAADELVERAPALGGLPARFDEGLLAGVSLAALLVLLLLPTQIGRASCRERV